MVATQEGQPVIGAPDYTVGETGEFNLLDLVQCRRKVEQGPPTCAFLAATVAGEELPAQEPEA